MKTKSLYALSATALTLALAIACSNSSGGGGGGGLFGGGAAGGGVASLHAATPGKVTPTSILGIWKVAGGETDDGAVATSTLVKIEQTRFVAETRCVAKASGQAVIAQVVVGASVSEDSVRIREGKKDVKQIKVGDQTLQCEASIDAAELSYLIRDGQVFAGEAGAQMELVLESKISD